MSNASDDEERKARVAKAIKDIIEEERARPKSWENLTTEAGLEDMEDSAARQIFHGEMGPYGEVIRLVAEVRRLRNTIIPTVIVCPKCGGQHVDQGEWTTRPHRSHLCEHCGEVWKAYDVSTRGVDFPQASSLIKGLRDAMACLDDEDRYFLGKHTEDPEVAAHLAAMLARLDALMGVL